MARTATLALCFALAPLCAAPAPRSSILAANNMAGATGKEQLVVACNGFPTKLSTLVGVRRPHRMTKLIAAKAHSQLEIKPGEAKQQHRVKVLRTREQKAKVDAVNAEAVREEKAAFLKAHPPPNAEMMKAPKTWNLAAELKGVLWTRHLGYGECKEFHIDLSKHELFFVLPGGNASCALDPPLFAEVGVDDAKPMPPAEALSASLLADAPRHLFAVGMQPHAQDPHCEVQAVALPNRDDSATLKPAELATVDAFTQGAPEKPIGAEAEIEEEERLQGLPALAPLDRGAQMRLEDVVQKELIASEIVGSRTLGLGHAYAVEPKQLHLLLEDIRQSRMIDEKDMKFQDGHSYLAMRLGRGGNASEFPEKLLVYECQECQNDATWMQSLEEDVEADTVQE